MDRSFVKFILFLMLIPKFVFAAACCGGGSAMPALISSDDASQVSAGMTWSQIDNEVDGRGVWYKKTDDNLTQTLKFDGAMIFSDLWQAGVSVPIVSKQNKTTESYSGVGDLSLNLGYEALPDWDYHPIRPKGHVYLQTVLPTAPTIYEISSNQTPLGKGFYSLGAGVLLTKNFKAMDVMFSSEVHYGFQKNIQSEQLQGSVIPGFGESILFGAGWNTAMYRFGGSLLFRFEDGNQIQGSVNQKTSYERSVSLGFSLAYLLKEGMTISANYSNQNWLGTPIGASLGESLGMSIQSRWAR